MAGKETSNTCNLDMVLTDTVLYSEYSLKSTRKRPSVVINIEENSANRKTKGKTLVDFTVTKTVHWNPVEDCALHRAYSPSSFLVVEFKNKCTPNIIKKVLNGKIKVRDCDKYTVIYKAFGYSASHLKERKYIFYNETLGDWDDVVGQFGHFEAIKIVSKKAARIGLLFSSSTEVARLMDEQIGSPVEDITHGGYNFTDGCGFISVALAKKIMKTLNMEHRYIQQSPPVASVYQVRFQGSKGVLMVNPQLNNGIRLRQSMIKFEWSLPAPHILGITEPGLSRPYKVANLNLQFTRLLSTLGVPDQVFLDKTESYLQEVATLDIWPGQTKAKIKFLCANEFYTEAEELMGSQIEVKDNVKAALKKIKKKIITAWDKKLPRGFTKQPDEMRSQLKLRLPVEESRNVYGVCDMTEELNYGECFFQPTVTGKPMVLDGVRVVVSKNPCYHPGDVRVLQCRNIAALHHLYDCIVFPVKGKRPHSNEIAGSDLDGDEYFVCWDKDLIPKATVSPASYKGSPETKHNAVTEKHIKENFAQYRSKMAVVNELYELWANMKGAGSSECSLLADFFSIAVDSAKTGDKIEIPEFLFAIKERPLPSKRFVWEKMVGLIDNFRTQELVTGAFSKSQADLAHEFTFEEVECLISDRSISVTEFMRFRLLLGWLSRQQGNYREDQVLDLLKIIDFSHFEPQHRINALEELHCYGRKAALLLLNSLYRSEILADIDIECVQGKASTLSWVLEDRMTQEDFAWTKVNAMMTRKAIKMLVLQITYNHDKCALVLTISDALQLHDSVHPIESSGKCSSSAYISVHGTSLDNLASPLQDSYMISLDGSRIQVYNSAAHKRTDTFICLMDLEDDYLGMSVALNKFRSSFPADHNNARVQRHCVEKVEMFCKHRKPHQTQRFSLLERLTPEDDVDAGEGQSEVRVPDFNFNEEDFPGLSDDGELTEYPHCKPLLFVTKFENLENDVLEALNSGQDLQPALDKLEECLDKPEICQEAALLLEFVVSHDVFQHKLRVSSCLQLVSVLLTLSESGLPRIERFVCSLQRLGIHISTMDLMEFLTHTLYTLPAKEVTMAMFLTSIVDSAIWRGLMLLDEAASAYFLHWASLLTVEQYHHMLEAADKAEAVSHAITGRLFASPDGDHTVLVLHILGEHVITPQDGFAFSVIGPDMKADDVPYKPLFYCGIAKYITSSILHLKLLWPSDEAVLFSQLKDEGDETRSWRVDLLPNLVTYNRMMTALEKTATCYTKNSILNEMVMTLVGEMHSPQADHKTDLQRSTDRNMEATDHQDGDRTRKCVSNVSGEMGSQEDHQNKQGTDLEKAPTGSVLEASAVTGSLNQSQIRAMEAALGETLTLIQGPPGTGKTVTAARTIQQWMEHFPDTKILACAETNEGINNIVKALLKIQIPGSLILRVGTNVPAELCEYSLEEQLRSHEKKDKYRYNELKLKSSIIAKAKIICSTCIGAGSTELKDLQFQNVLIDEAGQALEPACLVSLHPGVKRLCLIGDDKQLPPLVISPYAQDLKHTMFFRLSCDSHKVHMLNTQYRMHPQISQFPNMKFYSDNLLDAATCQAKSPSAAFRKLWQQNTEGKAVVYCDVQFCGNAHTSDIQCGERHLGPALSNPKELEIVVKLVKRLLENGEKPENIAVISPYRKQVDELTQKLKSLSVHVKTIDGFQGQEREIIIFSTVRANVHPRSSSAPHLGHLKDHQRLNVALTRARSGLVVLGHRETLKSEPLWKDWLDWVDKEGFVTAELCQRSEKSSRPRTRTYRRK